MKNINENVLVIEAIKELGFYRKGKPDISGFAKHIGVSPKTVTGWKNHTLPHLAEVLLNTLVKNRQLEREIERFKAFEDALKNIIDANSREANCK